MLSYRVGAQMPYVVLLSMRPHVVAQCPHVVAVVAAALTLFQSVGASMLSAGECLRLFELVTLTLPNEYGPMLSQRVGNPTLSHRSSHGVPVVASFHGRPGVVALRFHVPVLSQ